MFRFSERNEEVCQLFRRQTLLRKTLNSLRQVEALSSLIRKYQYHHKVLVHLQYSRARRAKGIQKTKSVSHYQRKMSMKCFKSWHKNALWWRDVHSRVSEKEKTRNLQLMRLVQDCELDIASELDIAWSHVNLHVVFSVAS